MNFSNIRPFVRFARYDEVTEDKFSLPWVPRDHRLFYVLEGSAQIFLEGQGIDLFKGDLIIIRSGTPYQHFNKDVKYIAFNFDYTDEFSNLIAPIFPNDPKKPEDMPLLEDFFFEDEKVFNKTLVLKNCFDLQKDLIKIVDIHTKAMPYSHLQTSGLFANILVEILHKTLERNANSVGFNFNQIIQYIQEQYAEPITNATIGEAFNYHPNYISTEFKRYTGKSLHSYILDYRISRAVYLIEEGEQNLNIIASKVGFSDYNYFSRYFKKTIGITPKKYIMSVYRK